MRNSVECDCGSDGSGFIVEFKIVLGLCFNVLQHEAARLDTFFYTSSSVNNLSIRHRRSAFVLISEQGFGWCRANADSLRLRSGQALKSCSSQSARAGRSRLHRQLCTSEDARVYIDNRARAGTLAPTSTTVRGRGRPRHTRRGPGRGVSRTPSLKSREDRHPPLTAESNSSAENLGHSPEGWQNSEAYAAFAGV